VAIKFPIKRKSWIFDKLKKLEQRGHYVLSVGPIISELNLQNFYGIQKSQNLINNK